MKLELDHDGLLALGYCVACGLDTAKRRQEQGIADAINRLADLVFKATRLPKADP